MLQNIGLGALGAMNPKKNNEYIGDFNKKD